MPQIILPSIRDTDNEKLQMQYLTDAFSKLRKELSFLLGNLDSDNVVEAQSVIADWVYAGKIKANQLIIGGPNGSISFNDLSDQPYIPAPYTDTQALAAWVASEYKTYINSDGLYTGTVAANKLLIGGDNGYISFSTLTDKPFIPQSAADVGALPIGTPIPTQYTDIMALAAWVASGYKTYIDENGVYTGTLTAQQVNAVEVNARRLVASDGAGKVEIDGSGRINMTSTLFVDPMYTPNNARMGIYPIFSSMMTSIIHAGDDLTEYTRTAGKLTLGLISNITATKYNTTVSTGGTTSWMGETGLFTSGFLTVTGAKNGLQHTVHYGDRLINAYETAEYYFGDIGSATIGESGEVVISIDEIFQECVNTTIPYHVFTQVYCGSISNIDRQVGHFTVKGAPGTEFSWELKAKRRGYESDRLETFDPGEHVEGSIIEMELNSIPNLENILLMEV